VTEAVRLTPATLRSLEVPGPAYDRASVRPGIVHIGVGAFHRAHQAAYLDELLSLGLADGWGLCGVGLLPGDQKLVDALGDQGWLYTLVLKHGDGRWEPRVIGSMVEFLHAPADPGAVLDRLTDPATRIVSLTITEGGYKVDLATHRFDADDPAVAADLADPTRPSTVFGFVVEALRRRREAGVAPFTVQSCDNLPSNGDVAKVAFTTYARAADAELGAWVEQHVAFPNAMVDRITPVTTDDDRVGLAERFGVDDAWPVTCEPFTQWVIEDRFPSGRPEWEKVGAQLVDDVEPYELMKLRLLNSGHQALAYAGYLSGHLLVHDAMTDPDVERFVRAYWAEALPTIGELEGIDVPGYVDTLVGRFSNPSIRDTLARLAADASDRIPQWMVPVAEANLAAGRPVAATAAVIASWARYAEGVDDAGEPIEVVDRRKERIMASAVPDADRPLAFLEDRELFRGLVDDERFTTPYLQALEAFRSQGMKAALAQPR
jgi:mannitol 2-dehydrogenase